ncbi:DinB family protein [uncultured Fluviicola sp.]|uniref:DinB family protein n=1 Tax=uncultured Fluviicola sp. TaxID=463303 RepID=UPI0025D335D1|nr:DinB family protein [uncultured Fluviicola sp.]
MSFIGRPNPEFAPAYAKYYFDRTLGQDDLLLALENNLNETESFIAGLPEEKADFQYADEKWTLKGVILHFIETERIFQYRALRFSRKDKTALDGFDEDWYARHNNTDQRSLEDLRAEFMDVRKASISLFKGMTGAMLDSIGTANNTPNTPRNVGWIMVGHVIHHCNIIKERYLVDADENF